GWARDSRLPPRLRPARAAARHRAGPRSLRASRGGARGRGCGALDRGRRRRPPPRRARARAAGAARPRASRGAGDARGARHLDGTGRGSHDRPSGDRRGAARHLPRARAAREPARPGARRGRPPHRGRRAGGRMTPAVASSAVPLLRRRLADYFELGKPRVVSLVLVTTVVGYYLGAAGTPAALPLFHTLALNQYLERDLDARMERTRRRPLPDGRLLPGEALAVGLGLLAVGLGYLATMVGGLPTLVTAGIAATYLLVYTPLKRVTPLCSLV